MNNKNNLTKIKVFFLKVITLAKMLTRQITKINILPWQRSQQLPTAELNFTGFCRLANLPFSWYRLETNDQEIFQIRGNTHMATTLRGGVMEGGKAKMRCYWTYGGEEG